MCRSRLKQANPSLQANNMTQELGFFSQELATAIGLEEAAVFNKLQWCIENPEMKGTIAPDGLKMIRNPIACTDSRKLSKSHGKKVDWSGNFPWLTPYKIRRIFARLEGLGLIVVRQLRARYFDRCKYYSVNYEKLAQLLEPSQISICAKPSNRSSESKTIDRSTERKSYQNTNSTKDIQLNSHAEAGETAGGLSDKKQEFDREKKQPKDCLVDAKVVVESVQETEVLQEDKCFVRSSSIERKLFFEILLVYCYQRVDIDSAEGYANWVLRECRSGVPEASAALLWEEFKSGEELGSRFVPPGYRLRGVPEKVVTEAVTQDCIQKVGSTPTEAAKNAASQLRRLPVVVAVATAVKLQLERAVESAARQVELGIPKERAIANNLPVYAIACADSPQADSPRLELESTAFGDAAVEAATDPYALTPESLAAREKARSRLNKKFGRSSAAERTLPVKIAKSVVEESVVEESVVEGCDCEPIPW